MLDAILDDIIQMNWKKQECARPPQPSHAPHGLRGRYMGNGPRVVGRLYVSYRRCASPHCVGRFRFLDLVTSVHPSVLLLLVARDAHGFRLMSNWLSLLFLFSNWVPIGFQRVFPPIAQPTSPPANRQSARMPASQPAQPRTICQPHHHHHHLQCT